MASEYTTNRRYPLYVDSDKPNLRDQYNGAIRMIDSDMDDALDASGHVSDALGAGFDAQHTVRMALDDTNAKFGSGISSSSTVTAQLAAKASTQQLADAIAPLATNTALQSEANARSSADNALSTRIGKLENPTRYIATIGDSFGNESTEWAALTANKTGYQLINRCTNEAGFSYRGTDGKTFIGQLQDIKNNSNFANVEYIIVYGGVNDFTMQVTKENEVSAITQFMTEYNAISGKKPKLIFAFGNFGKGPYRNRAKEFPVWYNYVVSECRKQGIPVVDYVPLWLACTDTTVYNSDYLHPNSTGENMISSYVQNLINGSYDGVHRRHVAHIDGNMHTTSSEEIANTRVAYDATLTLDNNIARISIKPSTLYNIFGDTRFKGNTWYAFGDTFGADQWCTFGQNDADENPLCATVYGTKNGDISIGVKCDPSTGIQNGIGIGSVQAFNFFNKQFYWKTFGSVETLRSVFGSWTFPLDFKAEYTVI